MRVYKSVRNRIYPDFFEDRPEIMDGLLLGDGYIQERRHTPSLEISQKQKSFVCFLRNLLCPSVKVKKHIHRQYIYSSGKVREMTQGWRCCVGSPRLSDYHRRWYKHKRKSIPKDLVLTSTVVLHWFLGDGSTNRSQPCITLSTNSFTLNEVKILTDKLEKILNFKFNIYRNGKGHIMQTAKLANVQKFLTYIGPCPIKCMKYKWKWM